jgi:hypothetical protein
VGRRGRTLLQPHTLIGIDGGHCLHRDATAEWLAAVASITD